MNILQSLSNLGWKEIGRYSKERQLTKTKDSNKEVSDKVWQSVSPGRCREQKAKDKGKIDS